MRASPVELELYKNRFASIAEEMGATLMRTAFSPNIKERRDFSCALFTAGGEMIAQAEHIPVHLGSMPLSVASALAQLTLGPGDMAMLNDPYKGGTHLPDVTLVAPVRAGEAPLFYVANRAHHADVGGMTPGSMPLSRSLFQEGLIIPPVKLVKAGRIDRELLGLILANVRTPDEREGDLNAQIMANRTGMRRLAELAGARGEEETAGYARALIDYGERIMRATLARVPDGVYRFRDLLDDDGRGTADIAIQVALTVRGDAATVDFRGSAPQTEGGVNAVRAITLSAVLYCLRCLVAENVPANAGCLRPVTVITQPGTVVDAVFPAGVAGGNVETAQRIVDAVFGALAQALPGRIPAASQGTMNNLTLGGVDPRTNAAFTYYETLGGGMGASASASGASGVHSHMTNTLNTPIEALEYAYPVRVTRYALRAGSGGRGKNRGGDGLIRELAALAPVEATVLSDRRARGPWGLAGGRPGAPGRNLVIRDGQPQAMPGKFQTTLEPGDRLRLETPGGGGYGEE
jgi:N-methylhydantoinase B